MISSSRLAFRNFNLAKLNRKTVSAFSYSTRAAYKEEQTVKPQDPKKIRNVRGCVPEQRASVSESIQSFAKVNNHKMAQKCEVNLT